MKYAVFVLSLVLLALLVMDFNNRSAELSRLTADHEVVEARLQTRLQTQEALVTQIAYATSEAAVADFAAKNHLSRPGNYPVVPLPVGEITPTPAPRPVVTPVVVHNWERWLSLFVDPRPQVQIAP